MTRFAPERNRNVDRLGRRLRAMFVGHTALALASKARAPKAPLSVLIAAVFGLDMLWPVFLLLGIEHVRIEPDAAHDPEGRRRASDDRIVRR